MELIPLDIWIHEILPRLTYSSWLSLSESCRFSYSICKKIRNPIRMYLIRKYDNNYYKYGWKMQERYYICKQSEEKEGVYKAYDTGKLKYECHYRNGMRNGRYVERRANGGIHYECTYYNDMLHGKYTEYYGKGSSVNGTVKNKIKFTCCYWYGVLHGKYVEYYNNSLSTSSNIQDYVKVSCLYLHGELFTIYGQWDINGNRIEPPTFGNPQPRKKSTWIRRY